jgi:hypothetical protein
MSDAQSNEVVSKADPKPDCYKCKHRRDLPGDCHSSCANTAANVAGNAHGIRRGWFMHPWNFDPVWLVRCDGFEALPALKEMP